ncbi:MAG: GTPase domain-containing protein [Candidatus Aminicenantes bacterium]|nr:GTPase domain-containing protein [Candidatus Aminicenantes bacterium]
MAFVNYNNKEITVKIVYYGPALSGKTTCLKYIYSNHEFGNKGKLITLDTDGDRTLFFDFLPIEIGKLGDYSIKIQLYTVPGQVSYDTTRKLVLQGSDGIVFVADSQVTLREQNLESFNNMKKNLELNNISASEIPVIFQYNKRDLKEILPIEELNKDLNPENKSFFPTIATTGENILEALHSSMKMVIIYLKNKLSVFQKDKTVMFSREEITSKSPKEEKIVKDFQDTDAEVQEDTEKEEVFELSDSMNEEISSADDSQKSDEIFSLGVENILEDSSSDFEVPEVEIGDGILDDGEVEPVKTVQKKIGNGGSEDREIEAIIELDSDIKNVDIPIDIKVPENKDEIRIKLNLRIVLKKK